MMSMFCHLPVKKEVYSVVSVKLTENQLWSVAREVIDEARIWFDEPREWVSYQAFLGFQISKAIHLYQIGQGRDSSREETDKFREETDKFIALVFAMAKE